MRGRLINPFKVLIARLDTVGTAADPDGAGPMTSGYDDVFREPVRKADGTSGRVEHTPVLVPCQIEVGAYEGLHETSAGDDPDGSIVVVFHFEDLEDMTLINPDTGEALIHKDDRLVSIHRFDDETLIQKCGVDGYFCTEAQPQSFGLSGGERNLLVCKFDTRDASIKNSGVSA